MFLKINVLRGLYIALATMGLLSVPALSTSPALGPAPSGVDVSRSTIAPSRLAAVCQQNLSREDLVKCIEDDIKVSRTAKLAEEDLRAQQAMATWARLLLFATLLQIPISVVGATAVVISVRQNQKSMLQARRAMDLQLRAYVLPAKITLELGPVWKVAFVARNTGTTPAEHVQACALVHFVDFPTNRAEWPLPRTWENFSHVAPSSPIKITVSVEVPEEQANKISSQHAGLLCFMWIRYRPLPDAEWSEVHRERIFLGEDLEDRIPRVIPESIFDADRSSDARPEPEVEAPLADEV